MAEHLTFNQGVRGSTPRWVTKTKRADLSALFVLLKWGVEPRAPRVACKPREKGAVHLLIAIDEINGKNKQKSMESKEQIYLLSACRKSQFLYFYTLADFEKWS